MRVAVNTQINRLSMPDLPEVVEVLGRNACHSWQIQLTVPMGRAADEPEVLLQPADMLELFPLLGRLKQRCDELGVRLWPGNNIGYFGPYESLFRGTMPRGHLASCGAGRTTLGIEADGSIKGCPSLPTAAWTGGNIRDNSLKDIWERSAPLRYTRDRTVEDLWGFCRTCYYADECRAGCTWTAFTFFRKPGNNPYCHHRALEMQRAREARAADTEAAARRENLSTMEASSSSSRTRKKDDGSPNFSTKLEDSDNELSRALSGVPASRPCKRNRVPLLRSRARSGSDRGARAAHTTARAAQRCLRSAPHLPQASLQRAAAATRMKAARAVAAVTAAAAQAGPAAAAAAEGGAAERGHGRWHGRRGQRRRGGAPAAVALAAPAAVWLRCTACRPTRGYAIRKRRAASAAGHNLFTAQRLPTSHSFCARRQDLAGASGTVATLLKSYCATSRDRRRSSGDAC